MHSRYRFLLSVLCTAFFLGIPGIGQAQTFLDCGTFNTAAKQAQCQEYNQTVKEEQQAQSDLAAAQAKSSSLSNDIAVLDAKIKATQLDIKAKNLLIQTLGNDITQKQSHINDLEGHIASDKQTLAELIRKMNELDSYSVAQVMLSQTSVSGFFSDLDTFQSLQQGLQTAFDQLRSDEASTSAEKDALTARQSAEEDARYEIQQQQKNLQADQSQQKQLLAISKGNEKAYTSLVAQKAAEAAKIKAALFPLAGGGKPIDFGTALQYANTVYNKTGVPQAFLLAIMTQESNLGGNVGTCYLTNTSDGSGVNARTGASVSYVMKPSRDVQPFVDITRSLGLDYSSTPVSCPQPSVGGYGGAMGPAQFIASTWILLVDRIKAALGESSPPNPWNPLDAFMASGLYLYDLGADASSYTHQRTAACKYYSGTTCYNATTGRANVGLSYGQNVMALASQIQQKINQLQ
ncbi:MAG: lytic murein transglycosylase [Patescibacteria group bacterium]|nr:lytic murein transglycosylase [Patescibacteria group bacterium]